MRKNCSSNREELLKFEAESRVGQNNFGNKIPFLTYSGPPGLQGPPGPKGEQGLKGNVGEVESDFKGPVSKYYQPPIPT